jgi:outer membrane lipoprotein carrier protein
MTYKSNKKHLGALFISVIALNMLGLNVYATTAQETKQAPSMQGSDSLNSLPNGLTVDIVNDPQAKADLRRLLAQFTYLRANFSQQIKDLQGEVLQQSSGQIFLEKPQKLRWSVTMPEESLLIADGKTVYNVDPFVEQVTLIDQADLTANNPLMLLVSDEEAQWQNVNIVKNENGYLLRPADANASISQVVLTFDAEQNLSSLSSVDKQQQLNVISFSDVLTNLTPPADQFTFVAPTGWVIDDQRTVD